MRGKKRQHRNNMDSQRENMIHRKEINRTGERERERERDKVDKTEKVSMLSLLICSFPWSDEPFAIELGNQKFICFAFTKKKKKNTRDFS